MLNMKEITKIYQVAIYIRLSKEDGDKEESNSVENQRVMLRHFVESQDDMIIYDEYVDDGYTGTNFERPDFKRMINDIILGNVNCVIVKDLSRFGRDYIETGYYIEKFFVDEEIRFISINDNIDNDGAQYDMIMPIKNIFNQQYAVDISKKIQTSFKVKQKEGQFIGAFASYGYKKNPRNKNTLIIDEYAADVVRRVFEMYSKGVGQIRIANILNEEGILCPSEYKKVNGLNYRNSKRLNSTNYWTYSTIHKMLSNEMYIGNMVQGKTKRRMKGKAKYLPKEQWIVVKNTHPAIISDELWQRVQNKLKRNTKDIDFENDVSIFAGLLKCGDCGRALSKNKNAGRLHYVCATYKCYGKGACGSHRVNQSVLEEVVLTDLNKIIKSIENLKSIVDKQKKNYETINEDNVKKKIDKYNLEIERINTNKNSAYNDYREGLLSKEECVKYRYDCDLKIKLLIQKRESLEKKIETKTDPLDSQWVKSLLKHNRVEKLDRTILNEMIDVIYVYEDRSIKIVYNFSNDLALLLENETIINQHNKKAL